VKLFVTEGQKGRVKLFVTEGQKDIFQANVI
jgi:hypothetical protein